MVALLVASWVPEAAVRLSSVKSVCTVKLPDSVDALTVVMATCDCETFRWDVVLALSVLSIVEISQALLLNLSQTDRQRLFQNYLSILNCGERSLFQTIRLLIQVQEGRKAAPMTSAQDGHGLERP